MGHEAAEIQQHSHRHQRVFVGNELGLPTGIHEDAGYCANQSFRERLRRQSSDRFRVLPPLIGRRAILTFAEHLHRSQ
eukprot:2098924-Prymnesium_polylepis.2